MEGIQVKITPFSGEKKDWERWSTTFLAKARLRGYRNVIVGAEIPPNKGLKDFEVYMLKMMWHMQKYSLHVNVMCVLESSIQVEVILYLMVMQSKPGRT
jgi:hypothetical protein